MFIATDLVSLKSLFILTGATFIGKHMLHMGSILLYLIVTPFRIWIPLHWIIFYRSKVDFWRYGYEHTKGVCPFIAYCVIKFKTIFSSAR